MAEQDNIMRNQEGEPVHVPDGRKDTVVKDVQRRPIVPQGGGEPMSQAPKDTLPKPVPETRMPSFEEPQVPATTQETAKQKAGEKTITYEELAAKKGFRSPDDLAASYANLESQNKRVEVTLAEAIKAREQLPQDFTDEEVSQVQEAKTQDEAIKIVNRLIDKRVRATEDKWEYQMYLMQNPDDRNYASDAIRIVKENPGIKWETAFKAAKADALSQAMKEAQTREQHANNAQQMEENLPQSMGSQPRVAEPSYQDVIEGIRTGRIPLSQAKQYINSLRNG